MLQNYRLLTPKFLYVLNINNRLRAVILFLEEASMISQRSVLFVQPDLVFQWGGFRFLVGRHSLPGPNNDDFGMAG